MKWFSTGKREAAVTYSDPHQKQPRVHTGRTSTTYIGSPNPRASYYLGRGPVQEQHPQREVPECAQREARGEDDEQAA